MSAAAFSTVRTPFNSSWVKQPLSESIWLARLLASNSTGSVMREKTITAANVTMPAYMSGFQEKMMPSIKMGQARLEPILTTGTMKERSDKKVYPCSFCNAWPASCAATPTADTLSDP